MNIRMPGTVKVPQFVKREPDLEEKMADIGKEVLAARSRGDRALVDAKLPPRLTLPPTAGNVFASNAIELLNKREELLNEAIMRASDLEMLAGEMIACGARIQDFMKRSQHVTAAIAEAKPALVLVPPVEEPANVQEEANDVVHRDEVGPGALHPRHGNDGQ